MSSSSAKVGQIINPVNLLALASPPATPASNKFSVVGRSSQRQSSQTATKKKSDNPRSVVTSRELASRLGSNVARNSAAQPASVPAHWRVQKKMAAASNAPS